MSKRLGEGMVLSKQCLSTQVSLLYTLSHWPGLQLGLAVGNVFKTCNSRETDAGGWEF